MRSDVDLSHPESERYKVTFEEYKLLLDWTNKLADRRQATSNLFFGVNGALLTIIGLAMAQLNDLERFVFISFSTIAGGIVSLVWASLLQRYQEILKFKYTHLALFEEVLGLDASGLVTAEDNFFHRGIPLQLEGKKVKLDPPKKAGKFGITLAEKTLAQLFLITFILLFLLSVALFVHK
ncbi:MAG: hypothetical protein H3C41_11900 [Bacteroidales bacterium]|nr:hypothetical protein [Bacteroidales bacterium]MCZ2288043.1 hypothetical protein [Anaerolineales bacterium]